MTECFVCRSQHLKTFRRFEQRDCLDIKASGASRLSTSLGCCERCGHIQQNPPIDPNVMAKLYAGTTDEDFVEFNQYRISSFKKAIRRISASTVGLTTKNGLDVGCGGGAFPEACQQLNIKVDGVEPSNFLSNYARTTYGLNIKTGFLEEVASELKPSYGFISFWDVLEHIHDINTTIEVSAGLLEEDGYIIINVPTINSWPARVLRKHWPMYLDVHVQYFSRESLTTLMGQHGFALVSSQKYYQTLPLGYVLYRGLFHITGASMNWLRDKAIFRVPLRYYIGQHCFIFQRCY